MLEVGPPAGEFSSTDQEEEIYTFDLLDHDVAGILRLLQTKLKHCSIREKVNFTDCDIKKDLT